MEGDHHQRGGDQANKEKEKETNNDKESGETRNNNNKQEKEKEKEQREGKGKGEEGGGDWRGVVVIGNTYLDEFVELDCFPTPDGKFTAGAIGDDLGGSATNAFSAFSTFGSSPTLHSVIGTDTVAQRLEKMLRDRDVDLSRCPRVEGPSGRTVVLLTPDGVSTKLGLSGVGGKIDDHLMPVEDLVKFSHIHLASVSLDLARKVLKMRDEYSQSQPQSHQSQEQKPFPTISLDLGAKILSADPRQLQELFVQVHVVSLNEFALCKVYGIDVEKPDTDPDWVLHLQSKMRAAIHHCTETGRKTTDPSFLITLGKSGAHVVGTDRHCFLSSVRTKVLDSTGAGDAFAAAFVTYRIRLGMSDKEALARAHVAASIKIQSKGGTRGHPKPDEIERRLAEISWSES